MANFIIPNEAERNTLEILKDSQISNPWDVRLFMNSFVPDANTVIGNFMEATGANGYTPQTPVWGAITTDATGRAFMVSGTNTFSSTDSPPQSIYGWYMTGPAGELLACERFADAPRTLGVGASIQFPILYRASQEP